ncbi:hypothetical protein WJX82_010760 [Trebouxia sp. C0006]
MGKSERPEHTAPPDIYYNAEEARKYTTNSRIMQIQETLTERALELLALPQDGVPKLLLDLGCGSGLSGESLTKQGHTWVGLDISEAMLDVAKEREVEGDLCLHDLGHGLPLRPGSFDGAISISAVQWLCNADQTDHEPRKRMRRLFESLYACLVRGGRAVLQIYPENAQQAEMLTSTAMKAGFSGGLVVDFPHSTRAKKYFLVLMVASRQRGNKRRKTANGNIQGSHRHPEGKGKDWVYKKKNQMRKKGYTNVPSDSKYTGRKRKDHW